MADRPTLSVTRPLTGPIAGVAAHIRGAPGIGLTGGSVAETAANDTEVGTLVVIGATTGTPEWSLTDDADGKFEVDSETGVITKIDDLDYEAAVYHAITAEVSGLTPSLAARKFWISVTDVAPSITSNGAGATATVEVEEDQTAVTTVIAADPSATFSIVGGADAALFSIHSGTGVLTFLVAPDFDTPGDADEDNDYEVTVQATAGVGTDTQAITVTVTAGGGGEGEVLQLGGNTLQLGDEDLTLEAA